MSNHEPDHKPGRRRRLPRVLLHWALLAMAGLLPAAGHPGDLDARVQSFLDEHRYRWRDLNVPAADGRLLHDLIVANGFRNALEIGTSTGHSTIWLAWALSKTGGKLVTIEIDPQRQAKAIENLHAAGLAQYVEFRLGDAHQIVTELAGPYDFVFSDADKQGYRFYFEQLYPKLAQRACFTAHNVRRGGRQDWVVDFLAYADGLADMRTHVDATTGAGLSISCRPPEASGR